MFERFFFNPSQPLPSKLLILNELIYYCFAVNCSSEECFIIISFTVISLVLMLQIKCNGQILACFCIFICNFFTTKCNWSRCRLDLNILTTFNIDFSQLDL